MARAELKVLFFVVNYECRMMNRLGDKLSDRNAMLDCREFALNNIKEYERCFDLPKCTKKFLIHRITHTLTSQLNA